jgi:hypothetical protein
MKTLDWILPLRNRRTPSNFYSKSPFRDRVFLGNTFILAADLILAGVILVKFWHNLSFGTILWMGLIVFGLLSALRWALISHREVSQLVKPGKSGEFGAGIPSDRALNVAANMTHLALFYAFLVGLCFLMITELLMARL